MYQCQLCGESYNKCWSAPNYLWKRITGKKDGSGIRCIDCFDKKAREMGMILSWDCSILSFEGTLVKTANKEGR